MCNFKDTLCYAQAIHMFSRRKPCKQIYMNNGHDQDPDTNHNLICVFEMATFWQFVVCSLCKGFRLELNRSPGYSTASIVNWNYNTTKCPLMKSHVCFNNNNSVQAKHDSLFEKDKWLFNYRQTFDISHRVPQHSNN